MQPIYLDYAATTPVDSQVAKAMSECLERDGKFANPASRSHLYGWQAEEAVEAARGQVATLLGADAREIVWTSGATESNNLALKGLCQPGDHLLVSAIEHKAVLDPAEWLVGQGIEVTYLEPDAAGQVSAEAVAANIRPNTRVVSVMFANNELGTINPIADIAQVCRKHQCLLHVDAAQAVGKISVDVKALDIDLLSVSAHKLYGPKGIGALYVRRSPEINVAAQIHGGGHERGMRSGTLPTHQCVGMGLACELAGQYMARDQVAIGSLRDALWHGIKDLPRVRLNGHPTDRLYSHLNVAFGGIDGEMLLLSLRRLAVSSGSACTSATMSPSYVLKAIGLSDAEALSSLRISLGRYTDEQQVQQAISHITDVVGKLHSKAS